jgi:hypothetical protein
MAGMGLTEFSSRQAGTLAVFMFCSVMVPSDS